MGEHISLGDRDGFEDALWCPHGILGSTSMLLGIGAPFWMIAAIFMVGVSGSGGSGPAQCAAAPRVQGWP